jgi:hypothetical protein
VVSCFSVTLFYSTLLALTDGRNHRQRVKLILVGLATLTGSSRLILDGLGNQKKLGSSRVILVGLGNLRLLQVQLCCCVSVVWFWREIGFGGTYILRVQYSCGIVLVFWLWWEIVFGFAYVLSVQYSCAAVSFLVMSGKSSCVI